MDKLIADLEHLTETMVSSLEKADHLELSAFVEERQSIIDRLQEKIPFSEHPEKYRERILRLLDHDEPIVSRMNQLKAEAGAQLDKIKQGRAQRNVYEAMYTPESAFFDRKK